MVAYAVYLTYRSERLKKVLEAGADTIKTLSNLNLKPGSSLVALGNSVRRKTMDRLSSNVGGSSRRDKDEGEYLVNDDDMSPVV